MPTRTAFSTWQVTAPIKETVPGKQTRVSGMVIGDGIWLTPGEIEQMRCIPEVVFINCCHLGRIESETDSPGSNYHRLAANLAAQFIRIGVRVVIAAGWAMEDVAAQTFVCRFYDEILSGATFGQAALAARHETYEHHRGFNTWGAYQCYGDPDYTLSQQPTPGNGLHRAICFHAPSEAITKINNLANDAATASQKQANDLIEHLGQLTQQFPSHWLKFAGVCAALGKAYGELGLFSNAIAHYQAAMDAENANFAFQALEQMANLQSRWAVQCWKKRTQDREVENGSSEDTEFRQKINRATVLLHKLCELGVTGERLSLLGSAYKRKAWVMTGTERKEALLAMRDNYKHAYQLRQEKIGTIDPYPLLNWLIGKLVLRWLESDQDDRFQQELFDYLDRVEATTRAAEPQNSDFWNTITLVDCALVRYLAQGDLAAHVNEIVDGYKAARLRGASPREFCSVLEHFEFLIEMVDSTAISNARKQQLDQPLRLISERLSALSDRSA